MTEAENSGPSEWPDHLQGLGLDPDDLKDRDYANRLLPGLDYEAQLHAIKGFLHRQSKVATARHNRIKKIDAEARRLTGSANDRAVEEYCEEICDAIYEEAAHSMAAVGMIAPFVESIFSKVFLNIGEQRTTSDDLSSHPRWQQANRDKWDCQYVWKNGHRNKDLVKGILQLADAVELRSRLPENLDRMLEALIKYRNNMFHYGFEWPDDARENLGSI